MLAALLCHASMFVSPSEFRQCVSILQQRSWGRMDRPTALTALHDSLSGEERAILLAPPTMRRRGPNAASASRAVGTDAAPSARLEGTDGT